MILKINSKDRYRADHGWLSSYHLFSFADYYDSLNMNFGVLRVFNDDRIDAKNGFGMHRHSNMEIVTIMLSGELTHEDNMRNKAIMRAGEVQYMSAGTGVMHSEVNNGTTQTHLYQIWLMPKQNGLIPNYKQKDFTEIINKNENKNKLIPIISDKEVDHAIVIQADARIHRGILDEGKNIIYNIEKNRGVFIYAIKGKIEIDSTSFEAGDQARISDLERLDILAKENSELILIDVML
jgi:redox-sensitive bicupin YhaK (pirin superfamily)